MSWKPFGGEDYWDFDAVSAWCQAMVAAHPGWVRLEEVGKSRHGRPMMLLTFGRQDGHTEERPAFWLDAGTHAAEWTGVMSALYTMSRWIEGVEDGSLSDWFSSHTCYVMPCVSPDGFQAMHDGLPFLRSTLRPPRPGTVRSGMSPSDIDGDGEIRWMRWRHPAGPWIPDATCPIMMRPRTVDDDSADAFFVCTEGELIAWDGVKWIAASREFGLDLNRNFPVDWKPFSMFGMDSGDFPGSEPESQAILRAFADRPNIASAVTNHTYTGCLLAPPASDDSPLPDSDIAMMSRLAHDAVEGTDYKVYKVYPEFMYDPKKPTIGTWDDTMSCTFGVAGYTLELWDPYRWAGLTDVAPLDMFRNPDMKVIRAILDKCIAEGLYEPWTPFDHPQLGAVEIGGIDYMHTVRNPPTPLLPKECERGFAVADRVRRAVPSVSATLEVTALSKQITQVRLVLENLGALPTSGLAIGESLGVSPSVSASLVVADGTELLEGPAEKALHHLDGWLSGLSGFGRNPIYPSLAGRGHRAVVTWLVRGSGSVTVRWIAGRGGVGEASAEI
ncbi:MAG: hypothetical protein ACI8RZ_003081 [Myxococcota bacterium]|jgi:hypothetical protein